MDPLLVRWRDIKKLIPEYRQVTKVVLGDGDTTSFWHDTWSEAGVLWDTLPALFSHCRDPDATMAEVIMGGGLLTGTLQPRLSAAARAELALLDDALLSISLQPRPNKKRLRGRPSSSARVGDFYAALRTPANGPPPLADINWDCFALRKVQIFFWILRHGRTRTRALLHRRGIVDSPECPFCPNLIEDEDHLFATCPRLAMFWDRLLPGASYPTSVWMLAEATCSSLLAMAPRAANTATIGVSGPCGRQGM